MRNRLLTVLAAALLPLSLALYDCISIAACGSQEQYCAENGSCTCGHACSSQAECDGIGEVCVLYRYDNDHGVCVDRNWLERNTGDAGLDAVELGPSREVSTPDAN